LFAHGYGCDQQMWRFVYPAFADRYRVILFDHVGAGGATRRYDPHRYASLEGYAKDVNEIVAALELKDVTFIGHSVSAMIGVLAARAFPGPYARTVMVCPSPRYTVDGDYDGGFQPEDIDELLLNLERNHLDWSRSMAPAIVDERNPPEVIAELTEAFCRMDPDIAFNFARLTFRSDTRHALPKHTLPTLVIQCEEDFIAPPRVGRYVAEHLPGGRLAYLKAKGHCPNLSAPEQTIRAIADFLADVHMPHAQSFTG
jgi:sigma-B regulation protein RsbQ